MEPLSNAGWSIGRSAEDRSIESFEEIAQHSNTDVRTLRGKLYTMSVEILLTWIIGQGGICLHRR
ncbi:hypothetical protein HanRHA438_Chr11g0482321 [Helianthus annuus]|nr:hypothetical protein HanRHA438_Chr11g0482321 [Helianthus annuus]